MENRPDASARPGRPAASPEDTHGQPTVKLENPAEPIGTVRLATPLADQPEPAALGRREHEGSEDLAGTDIAVRKIVEEQVHESDVELTRDDVEIEHVPVNQAVESRESPWEEGDTLVVPVYEEELVVTKRLVLKEHIRIRRVAQTEHVPVSESLRRERVVVETSDHAAVHQTIVTGPDDTDHSTNRVGSDAPTDGVREPRQHDHVAADDHPDRQKRGGVLEGLIRKVLE